MATEGKFGYYRWMAVVKTITSWDRDGQEILRQSQSPPGVPSKPMAPRLPDQPNPDQRPSKENLGCDCEECVGQVEQSIKNFDEQLENWDAWLANWKVKNDWDRYVKNHADALVVWEKQVEEHKKIMGDWKPGDPIYDSQTNCFLALRLTASIVSEDHRKAVIDRCASELDYLKNEGVTEETEPVEGRMSKVDVEGLRDVMEMAKVAVIGEEIVDW